MLLSPAAVRPEPEWTPSATGPQIMAERRREPQPLRAGSGGGAGAAGLAEHPRTPVRRGRRRDFVRAAAGARRPRILNAQPLRALRRLAAAAARAFRVPERQPHLEGEVRAQEIRKVGAVGAKDDLHLVFAETQMVEQEIARAVAQHLVQRRPRRRSVERRVEKLLDPGGDTGFPSRDSTCRAKARRSPRRARPRRLRRRAQRCRA